MKKKKSLFNVYRLYGPEHYKVGSSLSSESEAFRLRGYDTV